MYVIHLIRQSAIIYKTLFPLLLQAFVHVSTAYCNCDRSEIKEVIYNTPYDPSNIIDLVHWLPEDMLEKVPDTLSLKQFRH